MLKNTLLVTICLVLSSVLGFVAQIVFVSSFGASGEMDVYFTLLSVPTVVTGMSPIIFSSVLIPTFAKFKSNQVKLNRFIDSTWKFILLFAFLFSSIGFLISAMNMDLFIPEAQSNLRNIGTQVSLMIWIGSGFIIISSYLSAILHYNKQFFTVAWTSLLPASFMIINVVLFREKLGIRSISLGFCIAFIIQFIIFFRTSNISLNNLSFNINHITNKKLLIKQSFFVILSLLPFTALSMIAYFWASQLETGSVSYLGYSQSFAGFLSVTVSMGISIVSFPEVANNFANEKGESSLYKFEQMLRYVLLIGMFAAGALIVLRIPILTLFYERGSFNVVSINKLATVVPWYLLAAVFIGGLNLLRTLFYSRGQFKDIAGLGLITPTIFFLLAGVLKENRSFVGIGIAYAMTVGGLFFMTVYLARNKEVLFLTKNFIFFLLKNASSVLVASLMVTFSLPFISNIISLVVTIGVCMVFYVFVYFLSSTFIFRLNEIEQIKLILISKLKSLIKS